MSSFLRGFTPQRFVLLCKIKACSPVAYGVLDPEAPLGGIPLDPHSDLFPVPLSGTTGYNQN